jgi:hypothetical protein
MMNKAKIISEVGTDAYTETCKLAKIFAPKTGKTANTLGDKFDSDVIDTIVYDLIWWNDDLSIGEKLTLTFEVYQDMPCYAYLMQLKLHYSELSDTNKLVCLHWLREMVGSGKPEYVEPATYALWCDFFEDPQTVNETWAVMTEDSISETGLQKVLINSGPVPFVLKKSLYERLISETKWHYYIFRSLLHSQFDVYGKTDLDEARQLLGRLSLSPDTEHLSLLQERLKR